MKNFGHIGVLMGGPSSEREISLRSGQAVLEALQKNGCQVTRFDITSAQPEEIQGLLKKNRIDVAFIALHGAFGEDGTVQLILEQEGIPYTGSGVAASQIAIDKILTQSCLKGKGIPVPQFIIGDKHDKISPDNILKDLGGLPVVVKPPTEGSSIGITVVREKEDLTKAMEEAFRFGPRILIEQFIKGRELTVGILRDDPLPVIEIRSKHEFFDFTAKYGAGLTDYLIPAPLPENIKELIQQTAIAAYNAIGCRDFSRVDIMLAEDQKPYVLEINTIPGFTSTSLLPKAAKEAGYNFTELCLKLIELAYEKKK